MKILLSGAIQGNLNSFYAKVKEQNPHWVVCSGDYGIFPDPKQMDRASKKHAANDFAKHYIGVCAAPINIPTLTIAGAHDDNRWLDQRKSSGDTEILSGVHWLAQGYKTTIGWDSVLRVTGLGRVYSESTYQGVKTKKSHRHYTRHDIERACSSGPTDLLVIYEHLDCPGIRNTIYATRPKLILSAEHPSSKLYWEVQGIPVITLGKFQTKMIEWKEDKFIC
jgi:hypothetical protein